MGPLVLQKGKRLLRKAKEKLCDILVELALGAKVQEKRSISIIVSGKGAHFGHVVLHTWMEESRREEMLSSWTDIVPTGISKGCCVRNTEEVLGDLTCEDPSTSWSIKANSLLLHSNVFVYQLSAVLNNTCCRPSNMYESLVANEIKSKRPNATTVMSH